jgi:hypothetical protein
LDLLEKVRYLGGELECGIIRRAVDLKVLGDILTNLAMISFTPVRC